MDLEIVGYHDDNVALNFSVANEAVENTVVDIDRMNAFHLSPLNKAPDRHKYAAFLSKWIAKLKPIQLRNERYDNPHFGMLNAYFATYVLLRALPKGSKPLEPKTLEAFYYQFHFRDALGEQLSLLMNIRTASRMSFIRSGNLSRRATGMSRRGCHFVMTMISKQ